MTCIYRCRIICLLMVMLVKELIIIKIAILTVLELIYQSVLYGNMIYYLKTSLIIQKHQLQRNLKKTVEIIHY